jgi:phage terminase large subunit-like protein
LSLQIDVAWFERNKDTLDKETRRQVEQLLGEYQRVVERNPLEAVFPYPKQHEFLESRAFVKGFIGGNGTGKSLIGTVDDLVQACDERALPEHLRQYKRWEPPVPLRVAGPDDGVLDSTVLEKFRQLAPRAQLLGGRFDKAYNGSTRRLRFKNGSWILFNTFKQDRDSWAGVEVRRTRFDEEPPGEHGAGLYTESVARLRKYTPDAQIVFTMTPLLGLTWVSDLFEGENAWRITAGMRDNPHIDAEAVIRSLGHLSAMERKAIIDGLFVHFAGAVVNVTPEHVIPGLSPDYLRGKDVYIGIDPGVRRAGVVWVVFDRDNRMTAFDELYPDNATVETMARDIRAKNHEWGVRDPAYIIDPSARNRQLTNAQNVEAEFARHKIYCQYGQNDRRAGILQLRGRLESRGLHITESCTNLLWEAKRWLVATDEVMAESRAKVKGAEGTFATIGPDHLWDPLRYIAQERLWYSADPKAKIRQSKFIEHGFAVPARYINGPAVAGPPMGSMS